MKKPLILVTNDDGINAPGMRFLITLMKEMGDIVVVAPDKPQSGMGHAITVSIPVRLHPIKNVKGYCEFSCTGTPVDCVKLAMDKVLPGRPDIIVAGINHGSNASINIIYSGTMSAAIEGALEGVPSVGFSLDDWSRKADFSHTSPYIVSIVKNVLKHGLPERVCLNVNFPLNTKKLRGVKICRQSNGYWKEEFEERKDPHGRKYYWLTGVFENNDNGKGTDDWALRNSYVSVVPVHCDFTAHSAIVQLKKWKLNA